MRQELEIRGPHALLEQLQQREHPKHKPRDANGHVRAHEVWSHVRGPHDADRVDSCTEVPESGGTPPWDCAIQVFERVLANRFVDLDAVAVQDPAEVRPGDCIVVVLVEELVQDVDRVLPVGWKEMPQELQYHRLLQLPPLIDEGDDEVVDKEEKHHQEDDEHQGVPAGAGIQAEPDIRVVHRRCEGEDVDECVAEEVEARLGHRPEERDARTRKHEGQEQLQPHDGEDDREHDEDVPRTVSDRIVQGVEHQGTQHGAPGDHRPASRDQVDRQAQKYHGDHALRMHMLPDQLGVDRDPGSLQPPLLPRRKHGIKDQGQQARRLHPQLPGTARRQERRNKQRTQSQPCSWP
eukprot:scaffold7741_cov305-Pinguiococcus_pyrenoidosus.AAC.3